MQKPVALRIYGIVNDSIVDGPGLRLAVFTQGCPHACLGCHNPDSHDPAGGRNMPVQAIAAQARANPLLAGVTLTGGEPMTQAAACLALLEALPSGLGLWLYTGYTWAEIMQGGDADRIALAKACDVVVDGRFSLAQRSLSLPFRGSANQRLIDVKRTLAEGRGPAEDRVILWTPEAW